MRIPKKPLDINELLKKDRKKIFDLMSNHEIQEFITKCNEEYLHWDQLRYKEIPEKHKPEQVWALMKIFRKQQYKLLRFNDWSFHFVIQDESLRRLHQLDIGAGGHLETNLESLNTEGRDRYIISSLMEEAIASSQLEGAATTRKIAKQLLISKRKPTSFSEKMIVNSFRTMKNIREKSKKEITPKIILALHREITKDTLKNPEDEGRFRNNNETVVADPVILENIYHIPPDYVRVPSLIQELCDFANKDDKHNFIHPIIKGIILHFLIGYIHPFNDGNGRTARTIFYWYVLSRGYWLFEFMAVSRTILRSKTKYGLAYLYTETDDNDLTYFINYNLVAIEEVLHEMEKYITRKQKEQAEAMKLLQGTGEINLRQASILKEFIKHPEKNFIINEIVSTYGVAYDTARNDLFRLESLGHIKRSKVGKKYVFEIVRKSF